MTAIEHVAELVAFVALCMVVGRVWLGCRRFARAYRDWRNRLTDPVRWTEGPRDRRWW